MVTYRQKQGDENVCQRNTKKVHIEPDAYVAIDKPLVIG